MASLVSEQAKYRAPLPPVLRMVPWRPVQLSLTGLVRSSGRRLQRERLRLLVAYWRAHFQRQELPPGSLPEVCWQQGHPVWAELELALRAAASPVPARLASVPRSRYSRSAALSNSCP